VSEHRKRSPIRRLKRLPIRISTCRHERHAHLVWPYDRVARQQFRLKFLERWKAGDDGRRIVLRGHQVKKGLPVLFKEYPIGKARRRSRRQRRDELIQVLPVLRNVLRLHLVSMRVILILLSSQCRLGVASEAQTWTYSASALVSWNPRSTAWRTQARSHYTSAGCGQDVGANAQVRRQSIRGRPLGNASSCT